MINKKIFILISLFVVTLLVVSTCIYIYLDNQIFLDNSSFTLIENIETDVYSKRKISSYIKEINGKIINDRFISTDNLGEEKINFLYYNKKNKKRKGSFKVVIKDKEEPLVFLKNDYYVTVGSSIEIFDNIMCVDNYDNRPICKIEGEYDLNRIGDYALKYIAIDSSKNENKIDFVLHVKEKIKSNNTLDEGILFEEVLKNYDEENVMFGIDVSKWQKEIDFKKVKEVGASFVMIRVGHQSGVLGEYVLDPYFIKNIENAKRENLKVGVYFYSYANSNSEAKKQADWVLDKIKDYELDLPVVFDWECYDELNKMELSIFGLNKIADSFLSRVENKGYKVMLYGSKNYLNAIWKYHSYNVWLAHYTEKTDYNSDYVMWQMCQDGIIDGIKGYVDIDILYKNKY